MNRRGRILWPLALIAAACNGGGLALPGGSDLGGRSCASATDEATCDAIGGCMALSCPTCGGGHSFMQCIQQGQPYGLLCAAPCSQPACGELGDSASCDQRSDCYSLFSGDRPCNSSGCSNHFESCADGTPLCTQPGGAGDSCTLTPPHCAQGDANTYLSNGCPAGCAHADRCPK